MTILESLLANPQLKARKNKASKIAKRIKYYLVSLSIAASVAVSGYVSSYDDIERGEKVAEELIEICRSSEEKCVIRPYLKDNPATIPSLLDKEQNLTVLTEQFFPETKKTLGNELVNKNGIRVEIDDNFYFSSEVLGEVELLPGENFVYDSYKKIVYEMNDDKHRLEKRITNVGDVVSVENASYFTQGDSVFSLENGKIEKIKTIEENFRLRKIEGTFYAAAFTSSKAVPVTEIKDKKLEHLLNKVYEVEENQEFSNPIKVVYHQDGLYVCLRDDLYVVTADSPDVIHMHHEEGVWFKDILPYQKKGDHIPRLAAVYELLFFTNKIVVYKLTPGQLEREWRIECSDDFKFTRGVEHYPWLDREQFEKRLFE